MNPETAPVSVIVPCYRCSDTIERAIGSVRAQTLRPAEIVLVDDASDDDTLRRLKALQTDNGVDVVRIAEMANNSGPAAARNAGWDVARQPYIAFLDADDSWHPKKIELQYEYMASRPEIAYTFHRFMCTDNPRPELNLPEAWEARPVGRWDILLSNRSATPTVMLRRDLPFRFERSARYAEDYRLWMQIVLSGYPSRYLDVPLAFLHKPCYGGCGLSGDLWKMERGELAAYGSARREGLIGPLLYPILCVYSMLKHLRRVVIVSLRAK